MHVVDPTNPRRALGNGIEHLLNVGRRAADDAEHLGCRSLMLQRFAQLRVALLDFLKQPHVFNCYDGLRGKSFQQLDLLLGERADLQAAYMNSTDGNSPAQHRRGEHRPNADTSGEARCKFIFWHCCEVINMKGLPVEYGSGRYMVTA